MNTKMILAALALSLSLAACAKKEEAAPAPEAAATTEAAPAASEAPAATSDAAAPAEGAAAPADAAATSDAASNAADASATPKHAGRSVPVSIRDAQNSPQDRTWIQAQYPEYLEDLSTLSMNTGMFPASGEYGERHAELMARWFADDSSHPLVILKDERPAGFALVSRPPRNRRDQVDFRMAEFFVTLKSRRLGIGRDAARLIFNRFAGTWEIVEFLYNKPAVAFWRAILTEYTGGRFQETIAHGEVKQVFRSTGARTPHK